MTEKFKQLGISEIILDSIKEFGFEEPTEIQEKTIPLVLKGKDVIAGASTGSGKTLAFGCSVIENSKPDYGIQSLILVPTRELAEQVTRELRKFSGKKKLNIVSIYGGMSMGRQIDELESAEVVVGTPGRILDHLSRRTINFQYLKILVLDEADRMFDMGFKDDVEKIISQCPKERQTLLYSATISQDIVLLTKKHMKDATEVSAKSQVDPTKLSQVYYDVEDGLKFSLLKHLLENEKSKLVMVFCNTRRNVDFIANNLKAMDIEALPIHGGFTQEKRNRIMETFHSKTVHVLICTDVAARGLDVKGISHVYNYDVPSEDKEYIHRIGRTARAGSEGKVINIVTSRDYDNFSNVLKHYPELKIERVETPYLERVRIKWMAEKRDYSRTGSRGRGRPRREDSRSGRDNRNSESRRDGRRNDERGGRRYSRPRRDNRNSESRRDGRRNDGPRRGSGPRRSSGSSSRSSYGRGGSGGRPDNRPRPSYGRRSNRPRRDSRPRK